MAVKKILTVPNPILRKKSKPLKSLSSNRRIKKLVVDLIDTAKAAEDPEGVGLSAIQIGKPVRVLVIKKEEKFIPLINPKITWRSKKVLSQVYKKEEVFLEGCLSIPNYYGFVDRSLAVKIKWQDLKGKVHQEKFEDKQASYIQHELDHLDGILFTDRILEQGGEIYKLEKNEKGKDVLVEVKLA